MTAISTRLAFLRACKANALALTVACLVGCNHGEWSFFGPMGIDYHGHLRTGRAVVIAVNPNNPDDVWLGAANGGVWHTAAFTQASALWEPMMDGVTSLAVGALALDQCDATRCNTVWVGTGENSIRRDTYYGAGLVKIEWNATDEEYVSQEVPGTKERFAHGTITKIVLNAASIYVSVSVGKTASASSAVVRAPEPVGQFGVHRSDDGGATWQIDGRFPQGAPVTDLALSGTTLVAGVLGLGVFTKSTGGEWCPRNPGIAAPASCPSPDPTLPDPTVTKFDHVEIETELIFPTHLYAVFGKCATETDFCYSPPEFYRSLNAGVSWIHATAAVAPGDYLTTYSQYTHALAIRPDLTRVLFYGGVDLWVSGDDAANFGAIPSEPGHQDQHQMLFPSADRNVRYVINDGGVYRTTDGGYNWYDVNYGLPIAQFYSIAVYSSQVGSVLLGGLQDNGAVFYSGDEVWEQVTPSDGGDAAIESADIMYLSNVDGPEFALPYATATGAANFAVSAAGINGSDAGLLTAPLVQHPKTKDLYFGTNRLYWRPSGQPTWQAVSPVFDAAAVVYPDVERRNAITTIAVAKSDSRRIYVGLYDGSIWRSECGPCLLSGCWRRVGGPGVVDGLPDRVPTSLEVDPKNQNHVYVTYSGFQDEAKVWASTDGGISWQPLSSGLEAGVPANVIKADPRPVNSYVFPSGPDLWLGTDRGVYFRSGFLGGILGWQFYGPSRGMPNVPVYDIAVDSSAGEVYAATHGRGVFKLGNPNFNVYQVWRGPVLTDVFISANGFRNAKGQARGKRCKVDVYDAQSRLVASVQPTAERTISLDANGRLLQVNTRTGEGRALIPLCRNGRCEGLNPRISPQPRDSLRLTCGDMTVQAPIRTKVLPRANPPTSMLLVERRDERVVNRVRVATIAIDSASHYLPICETVSTLAGRMTPAQISAKIQRSLVSCKTAASSSLQVKVRSDTISRREDASPAIPFITLRDSTLVADRLTFGVRLEPGDATGISLQLASIRGQVQRDLVPTEVVILTGATGAQGGSVQFSEHSGFGNCQVTVQTRSGQTASEVAQSIYAAIMERPEPRRGRCDARQNPFDLSRNDSRLITLAARGLRIAVNDSGVGFQMGPEDLSFEAIVGGRRK